MGSRTQDIRALTFPKTMIVKAALLCYLVLTPAVFSFTVPAVNSVAKKQSSEVEARQFSDDDIINYGIWGFIAGLSDYFIRNAVTVDKKNNNNYYNYYNHHHYCSSKIQTKARASQEGQEGKAAEKEGQEGKERPEEEGEGDGGCA